MGYLNRSKIVSVIAYLLIAGGIIAVIWSIQPTNDTKTIELPAEEGVFYLMTVSGQMSGHISGDFEVDTGSVNVYILNKAQYDIYWYELDPDDSMYSESGSQGTFSVDLPDTAKYYVCIDHEMNPTLAQTVTIHLEISGITVMLMAAGVVLLVVGAVLAVMGLRMRAKEKAMMPAAPAPESQPTDVTMFDTKRKT